MKRLLTNQQRQAVKNVCCLVLAIAMLACVFALVPMLAGIIPKISGSAARGLADEQVGLDTALPVFALGSGNTKNEQAAVKPEQSEPKPSEPEPAVPSPTPNKDDLLVSGENLCWYEMTDQPTLNIINRTSYKVDLSDFLTREFPITRPISAEPKVLIIHTHGSESYLQDGYNFYSPDEDFRSHNKAENVVGIGELLAKALNERGVPTIQDQTMHDVPDYNSAYVNSANALENILKKYPTVDFVIDIHRDSIFDSAGNNIKPITVVDGLPCAQLMIVVGTNEMGIPHPSWRDNLTFATYLQQELNTAYPTLARPINLRKQEFNQSYTKGSIILEVGSCGNTAEEAENAILLFAECYANLLKKQLS